MPTLIELAGLVGGQVQGDTTQQIDSVATLAEAKAGQISFYADTKYAVDLAVTRASAIIVGKGLADSVNTNRLLVDDPHLALALIIEVLQVDGAATTGIHPTAVIDSSVKIGEGVSIGAFSVVEPHVVIDTGAQIGAHCSLGRETNIGADTRIDANVTIYPRSRLGKACHVLSGTVIGSDGFGFVPDNEGNSAYGGWKKIPQIGRAVIGDQVHIGANTVIDRGSIGDTIIADGVIMDNLIQVAHNVKIGRNTALAGCVAIAGSTQIGANCRIAGRVAIVGHISICDEVTINADSLVTRSIDEAGTYSSGLPAQAVGKWRRIVAKLRRLA